MCKKKGVEGQISLLEQDGDKSKSATQVPQSNETRKNFLNDLKKKKNGRNPVVVVTSIQEGRSASLIGSSNPFVLLFHNSLQSVLKRCELLSAICLV